MVSQPSFGASFGASFGGGTFSLFASGEEGGERSTVLLLMPRLGVEGSCSIGERRGVLDLDLEGPRLLGSLSRLRDFRPLSKAVEAP